MVNSPVNESGAASFPRPTRYENIAHSLLAEALCYFADITLDHLELPDRFNFGIPQMLLDFIVPLKFFIVFSFSQVKFLKFHRQRIVVRIVVRKR